MVLALDIGVFRALENFTLCAIGGCTDVDGCKVVVVGLVKTMSGTVAIVGKDEDSRKA